MKISNKFCSRKSKVLKREKDERFLSKAPDSTRLPCILNVLNIFSTVGVCLRQELMKLTLDGIKKDKGNILDVTIPDKDSRYEKISSV